MTDPTRKTITLPAIPIRDMVLFLNRTMRVWGGQENFWRGPMHRAQGEAMAGVGGMGERGVG